MKFLSIAILIFCYSNLSGQCIVGNCINGIGTYNSSNGIYKGQFKNGRFHGKGSMKYTNGKLYSGSFVDGYKTGIGKLIYKDKSAYIGDFYQNLRHGKGKMTYANGDIYKGHWFQDQVDGIGEYIFSNGDYYQGDFQNNLLHGNGKLVYANGKISEGVWENNTFIGLDPVEFASTSKAYKDCTNIYCHDINGAYYYSDGSIYFGEFFNGNPEGSGKCEYINGDVYVGGWKSHGPHGQGVIHVKDGAQIAGIFDNGRLVKRDFIDQKPPVGIQTKSKPKFKSGSNIYAVIVGVANYHHMQSLKYTDDDAYQLYAFLKSPNGGAVPDDNIKVLIDDAATRINITKSIREVFQKADEDDVVLLYLSGHGLHGAFVPFDFDGRNNLLSYDDVLQSFKATHAKNKVFITDACHSGSMLAAKDILSTSLDRYYSSITDSEGGLAILTSSKADEVSLEFSGMRQGVFSHFLIRGLKGEANANNDAIVDITELFNFINRNVKHYTNNNQSPSIRGSYNSSMPVAMVYDN